MTGKARGVIAAILMLGAGPAVAGEIDSVYTRYDWQADCEVVRTDPQRASASLVCPGPEGLNLLLADDDARMSLDYRSDRSFGPWESFATFNSVHDVVEWRRHRLNGALQPIATIHRWFLQGQGEERQLLVVSTVARAPDTESCMVGWIDATATPGANRLAREVADSQAAGFACGTDSPQQYGKTGPRRPRHVRASR
jgi:hypothetical protein